MTSSLRWETTAQYSDVVGPAIAAQGLFQIFLFKPWHGFDDPFALAPRTLALMHGSVFVGDGVAALEALADDYDRRLSNWQAVHTD